MPHDELWLATAVEYVLERTKHVIETFGARDPGSEGEGRAQVFVQEELKPYADDVYAEAFRVAPKAFMGFLPISGILFLLAILGFHLVPVGALAASIVASGLFVLESGLYRQALDPFFPKRTSHNVYAVRKAAKERKRRIILGGHVDAAYEWRYNLMGVGVLRFAVIATMAAMVCLLVLTTVQVCWMPAGRWWGVVTAARFVFVLPCVMALFFTRFSVVVPGAADNLSGVFTAMAVFRHLGMTGTRFDHTEVCCLVTGSEEAGLRGAKAFAASHAGELKETPTVFLALDTLRDTEHLAVFDRDLNGFVRNDAAFSAFVCEAGASCGYELPLRKVYLGASDAAAFSQAGIPATLLGGMDPAPPRYYHTRLDHWSNLLPECLKRSLAIVWAVVQRVDEGGV